MGTLGTRYVKRLARRIRNKLFASGVVLMYHGIDDTSLDPHYLFVTPSHFVEHLEVLRKQYKPMSLNNLGLSLINGRIPEGSVAVTFDDGYANNLYNAKPLLEKYDMSATFFIISGKIGSHREFWWDELEEILLKPKSLQSKLLVDIRGRPFQFELGDLENYDKEDFWRNHSWHMECKHDPTERHRIYRFIHDLMLNLKAHEQDGVLDDLRACLNIKPKIRQSHRILSQEELKLLSKGELVEIGAHTVTHPILSMYAEKEQEFEIRNSASQIENLIGRSVNYFAYPYGSTSDYTTKTISIIKDVGFKLACSTLPGPVWRNTDLFQLNRFMVQDWDGDTFAKELRNIFER